MIMYLPTEDLEQRAAIGGAFKSYKRRAEAALWEKCVRR